jgi:hypothetical protein
MDGRTSCFWPFEEAGIRKMITEVANRVSPVMVKPSFGRIGIRSLPRSNSPILRLNTICPYYTMFPLSFPFRVLNGAQPNEWVLDPFCGRGTTNFAARLRGIPCIGVDSNPVAAAIAAAKHIMVAKEEVVEVCRSILADTSPPRNVPSGEFWKICYGESTLMDICKIREHLLTCELTESHIALRALMLGILHGQRRKGSPAYLSNQMPRTYATKPEAALRFWNRTGHAPPKIDVLDVVSRRAEFIFTDIPSLVAGNVVLGDSRDINSQMVGGPFKWVITSPPYYGMDSYGPDQWLRNWFMGGPDTVTYGQDGQLSHGGENIFIAELANIWHKVSLVCSPEAHLIIRFGALPSLSRDPGTLLKKSIKGSNCGWRVVTIRNAGTSPRGRRQADQFGKNTGSAIEEIDLYAILE